MGRSLAIVGSVLEAVRAIGPTLAARSDDIEQNRSLPASIVDLVKPTGAFRMYVPNDLNGPEVAAWESLQVLEELAFHDGSVGWCSMIGSTTSLLSSYLPDPFAVELFSSPDAICGGFAMPRGRAVPVEGGLRVTGQWAWGSGTRHSTHIAGGCLVVDADGKRSPRADGLAAPFVFFEPDQVEFIDNWHVTGMSGSGSGDYAVTEAFVPEGRWVQMGIDEPRRDNPLSRFSFYGLLACGVAACAVGIARRSLDEFRVLATSKKPQGSRRTLSEREQIQADVAVAEAQLSAAWAYMCESTQATWSVAVVGDDPTVEHKRLLRLSATHATQTAAAVAERMYKAAGGSAVYKTSPIQRTFRDAFVATQHAMVAPRTFEVWGRLALGLDTDTRTL